MDENKISFIICSNNDFLCQECQLYIENLIVPDRYHIDIIVVNGELSMAGGYNYAMKQSDAKYKVYLHQDVLIVDVHFIENILKIFTGHMDIGMIGMVGNISIADNGCPWVSQTSRRVGKVFVDMMDGVGILTYDNFSSAYQEVLAIDGLLMATQYDLRWREDLFQGFHFYDLSQSMEFIKCGYKVVVPNQTVPWSLHDNDVCDSSDYEHYRKIFEKEYKACYMNEEILSEGNRKESV